MAKSKPQCPRCGSEKIGPRGHARGKRRFNCLENDCNWHGTNLAGDDLGAAGIDRQHSKNLATKIRSARGPRRYVVTAAQNATPIRRPFFDNLIAYCKANAAELLVIPYRYRNPTSMWTAQNQDDDWWAPELEPYLINERVAMNEHLTLLADVMTQPTASNPLQGYETLVGASSAIIGHPKLALTTVPTPQQKLPKILTTTGSITQKNYISGKAGKKGEHHHTFGAAVIEIKGSIFHLRQINAVKDGSFCDLDKEYKNGKVTKAKAAALVLGDLHEEFLDPKVAKATFGPGGLAELLQPGQFIFHDVHDFYSQNHHHDNEPFIKVAKSMSGMDHVQSALRDTFDTLAGIGEKYPNTLQVFVASNHPDALAKWVKKTDWRDDPLNAVFYLETALAMAKSSYVGPAGASTIDPFVYWGKRLLPDFKTGRYRFLERDESWMVKGIECGQHGDVGANGARGSRKSLAKIGVKTVIGHSHSPGIEEGCYQAGTSSRLNLEYNRGASGWLNTHVVIYSNGKRSLINIIDGKFKA